jgi:hypothetical protein
VHEGCILGGPRDKGASLFPVAPSQVWAKVAGVSPPDLPKPQLIFVPFSSQVREKEPLPGEERVRAVCKLRRGGWLRLP